MTRREIATVGAAAAVGLFGPALLAAVLFEDPTLTGREQTVLLFGVTIGAVVGTGTAVAVSEVGER